LADQSFGIGENQEHREEEPPPQKRPILDRVQARTDEQKKVEKETAAYIVAKAIDRCNEYDKDLNLATRTKRLSHTEWSKFNKHVFDMLNESYSASVGLALDTQSLVVVREALTKIGPWGWYVWERSEISKYPDETALDLPEKQEVKTTRAEIGKDIIYQKWRGKYNNNNQLRKAEAKEKKRLGRQKTFFLRKNGELHRQPNGKMVNQHGTLVGVENYDLVTESNNAEYKVMVKNMKTAPTPTIELANELSRLWETNYAVVNRVSQDDFKKWHKSSNLQTVSNYLYYETYAGIVCQLPKNSMELLAARLFSFAEVMPEIYRDKKYTPIPHEQYKDQPLIATLYAISEYFKESNDFVVMLGSRIDSLSHIEEAVVKNGQCNVIVNYDFHNGSRNPRRFGVASQGVPFINNLTEEEAVFVFATSPDVFGYRPDSNRQKKSKRIHCLVEVLRRGFLGIRDYTTSKEVLNDFEKSLIEIER
jgi:hypothetical protein